MKYDYWGLLKHLKHPLKSVYVLHGDETLLQQEALIALRQAANKQGFTNAMILIVAKLNRKTDLVSFSI